jgi:hypothetical protein
VGSPEGSPEGSLEGSPEGLVYSDFDQRIRDLLQPSTIWDQPFLLLVNIFINIPLLKETILKFGTGARWFITHGAQWNLTLHVGEGEETALVGWDDSFVETGGTLGAEFITGVDVLCWGTLTRHVRGGTIEHGVGSAATTVEGAGLRIHENLIRRLHWGDGSLILNDGKTRLELIRHLLLHKNIYLRWTKHPTSFVSII